MSTCEIRDPKVIEPKGFDVAKEWSFHRGAPPAVDADGQVNWRAAFDSDPGVVGCPECDAGYWNMGAVIECIDCGLRFPTNWWPMFAWGCQSKFRGPSNKLLNSLHRERMRDSRAYEHGNSVGCPSPWEERLKQPWRKVLASLQVVKS